MKPERDQPRGALPPAARIADIEILRGIAVLFVVMHHANGNLFGRGQFLGNFLSNNFGGWAGVDLFFAISGFVIALTLLPSLAATTSGAQYRQQTLIFWGKRALRIMPSAWFWLCAILVLVVAFNESGVFGELTTNLWATLAGVLNFANFRFADALFQYPYGVSFVYWSLSLEEQFYLLLPLAFFLSRRFLAALLVALVAWQFPQERGLWGMAFRSDAICLGVLIAIFFQHRCHSLLPGIDKAFHRILATGVLIALLVALPVVGALEQHNFPLQIGVVAIIAAAIVQICAYNNNLLARLPGATIMLWIGTRSYAIYLIHIPAFFSVRELAYRLDFELASFPWLVFTLTISLILALAELNFRYIETPIKRISRRLFP